MCFESDIKINSVFFNFGFYHKTNCKWMTAKILNTFSAQYIV